MKRIMNESERLQILEMIEKGIITASEGVQLLNSLPEESGEIETHQIGEYAQPVVEQTGPSPEPEVIETAPSPGEKTSAAPSEFDAEIRKWRRWWWVPLTIGIGITAISGLLMTLAYQNSSYFWFGCLWVPLLFGVLVISLAAASRTTRWLHVRVHQEPGEWPKTIAISMPIPIRFTAWLIRIFKPHIHGMDGTNLDEVILALDKTSPDQPFYVRVDEGEEGEKVEVYIG
jgi:hypothetical protein